MLQMEGMTYPECYMMSRPGNQLMHNVLYPVLPHWQVHHQAVLYDMSDMMAGTERMAAFTENVNHSECTFPLPIFSRVCQTSSVCVQTHHWEGALFLSLQTEKSEQTDKTFVKKNLDVMVWRLFCQNLVSLIGKKWGGGGPYANYPVCPVV